MVAFCGVTFMVDGCCCVVDDDKRVPSTGASYRYVMSLGEIFSTLVFNTRSAAYGESLTAEVVGYIYIYNPVLVIFPSGAW
jgi:hypothetical protein